jgi:hypothetical protein
MLEDGVARAVQVFAPCIALLLFIKSTEYRVNPVSSIQYQASWSIAGAVFCPNNMAQLYTKFRGLYLERYQYLKKSQAN